MGLSISCGSEVDAKVYPLDKKRIYAYQYMDASIKFSTEPILDASIICYRSLHVSMFEERIKLLIWMLHKRHHLETVIASHDDIRDAMDRINLLTDEEIRQLSKAVDNKEIGKTSLENESRKPQK